VGSQNVEGQSDGSDDDAEWHIYQNTPPDFLNSNHDPLAPIDEESSDASEGNDVDVYQFNGLHWQRGGNLEIPQSKMNTPTGATLKDGAQKYFRTPIDSLMAMLPIMFWDKMLLEINRYADQILAPKTRKLIAGYAWKPVRFQELMTYFGLLFHSMHHPQTGQRVRDAWSTPFHCQWTKFMAMSRYLQITSVLHFNDNSDIDGAAKDSLHKIRPLLNIIKRTLGRYANFGAELSFDEATMACRSSFGRHLICFNPKKPTGKFHFLIYMLCCGEKNLVFKFRIHT
jgi:hypothetical protein